MRIQIVSDLHLEFGPIDLVVDDADVLIAAGDINLGQKALMWLKDLRRPVIYVAGNHEYWGQGITELNRTLRRETRGTSIKFLENESVTLDGVRFLGCTLWTDFNASDSALMNEMLLVMNDFRYIRKDNRGIRPSDLVAINRSSRQWLQDELSLAFNGKTVVVTHHAPLMRSWYNRDKNNVRYAYCNDLGRLMEGHDIDLWVHGHVHEACDYVGHGVHVVCNPRGYHGYSEVRDFDPAKLVSLG